MKRGALIKGHTTLQEANNIKNQSNPRRIFETPKIAKKGIGISFEEIGCELKATYVVVEPDGSVKETGVISKFILTAIECQLAKIGIITMLKTTYNCDVKYETL